MKILNFLFKEIIAEITTEMNNLKKRIGHLEDDLVILSVRTSAKASNENTSNIYKNKYKPRS